MINFTVYSADCVCNSGNCLYPNKNVVTDKESFIAATRMDHVTAKYKGNYRSKDNFESSDCIPLDCDNDHSQNPEDWLTPLILHFQFREQCLLHLTADITTFQRVTNRQDRDFMCSSLYQR